MHANIDVHSIIFIAEFPKDRIKCIGKLQTFDDKSRYEITFQQVTQKGGESAINYIKRDQKSHNLSVSVGNCDS